MSRKKAALAEGYLLIGIIAMCIAAGNFVRENPLIIVFVLLGIFCIVAVFLVVKSRKNNQRKSLSQTQNTDNEKDNPFDNFPDEALFHLKRAQDSELKNDFLGARVGYLACVELLKRDKTAGKELKIAKKEYSEFVRRDPVFNKMLPFFLEGIRQNQGLLQSDITAKAESITNWAELQNYNRSISKDDIRYVLYFAEEFGYLIRKKEGRSYRLYLPEQLKNVTEKD